MIVKEIYEKEATILLPFSVEKSSIRTRWISVAPPTFTQDREYLDILIPDREKVYEEIYG